MPLDEFNTMPAEEAHTALRPCLDVTRWVQAVADTRPYSTVQQAAEAARTVAHPLTDAEIEAALEHHPRIGEKADDGSVEADLSQREQQSLGEADQSVEARLAAGNRAYEQKFGRVFLIRAAGRTHEEILRELERRLTQDPEPELAEVGDQLEQIAALRLEGLLR